MFEKHYQYKSSETKLMERIFEDENVNINHMVLKQGDSLPEHYANSNVYMIVIQGTISLQLEEQEGHSYPFGSIVNIPYSTKMNISNHHKELLEFFVFKAPGLTNFKHA